MAVEIISTIRLPIPRTSDDLILFDVVLYPPNKQTGLNHAILSGFVISRQN